MKNGLKNTKNNSPTEAFNLPNPEKQEITLDDLQFWIKFTEREIFKEAYKKAKELIKQNGKVKIYWHKDLSFSYD